MGSRFKQGSGRTKRPHPPTPDAPTRRFQFNSPCAEGLGTKNCQGGVFEVQIFFFFLLLCGQWSEPIL
jgi:hypothetical protein